MLSKQRLSHPRRIAMRISRIVDANSASTFDTMVRSVGVSSLDYNLVVTVIIDTVLT